MAHGSLEPRLEQRIRTIRDVDRAADDPPILLTPRVPVITLLG
jgi:hypothetical protein